VNTMQTNATNVRNQWAEKELLYMKDFLAWELLAMKKCNAMAQNSQDPDVKAILVSAGQRHEQHYRKLLQQLH
jgi:hypothetical protein